MSNTDPSMPDLAASLLSEAGRISDVVGIEAQDAHADATAAVRDVLAVADQAANDLAELDRRRDLIPATGFQRLQSEAVADANSKATDARRRLERSMATLKEELTTAALPAVDQARESLAREELRMALGGAEGDKLMLRAMDVASRGSYEGASVLFTPFFRTMMAARGVQNPDLVLRDIRKVAAAQVQTRGRTAKELEAYAALQRIGKIEGALAAANAHLRRATRQAKG